ncbi:MAG: DUF423 domain-containing protein [Thiotrichaceae bacterium]
MTPKFFFLAGAISGLFAVILGAFGAHGIEKIVTPKALEVYKTGIHYQFYHSFALIAAGMFAHFWPKAKYFKTAGFAFLLGIIIFSGSLYLYTLTGNKVFGMITPLGGLSFIVGWGLLITALWKTKI